MFSVSNAGQVYRIGYHVTRINIGKPYCFSDARSLARLVFRRFGENRKSLYTPLVEMRSQCILLNTWLLGWQQHFVRLVVSVWV